MEQAQRDLILDEPKHDDKAKCKMSLGASRCALLPPRHQAMPVTPSSMLPAIPLALASPMTLVPQEAPEEIKPEGKGNDPAINDSSKAET